MTRGSSGIRPGVTEEDQELVNDRSLLECLLQPIDRGKTGTWEQAGRPYWKPARPAQTHEVVVWNSALDDPVRPQQVVV